MTEAEITTPKTHSPKSFSDLEGPICDARYMSEILTDMIGGLIRQPREVPKISQYLYCPEEDCEKLQFAVFHLRGMIIDLRTQFYEAFEAQKEVQS
jgi:hypothetical protein